MEIKKDVPNHSEKQDPFVEQLPTHLRLAQMQRIMELLMENFSSVIRLELDKKIGEPSVDRFEQDIAEIAGNTKLRLDEMRLLGSFLRQ